MNRWFPMPIRLLLTLVACLAVSPHQSVAEASSPYPTRSQAVAFTSGEIQLAGTLTLPDGPGPHPAMVVIHGSGPADRSNWAAHTKHFPEQGIALLRYDKRGVGESTGNWLTVGPRALADDVLAGVAYLQSRSEIDPRQIGVWGGSQGWTIGLLAAARSRGKVAFAILVSGAPEGQWEQEKYRVRQVLRQDEATQDTWNRVAKLQALIEAYLRAGEGDELRLLAEDPAYQPALHYVIKGGVLPPDDHPVITYWRRNINFRPLSIVKEIDCPVLSIWGEKDFLVNSHAAANMTAKAFQQSGHSDYTWRIYPDADHGMYHRKQPGPGWASERDHFTPGFTALMTDWLSRRVKLRQSVSE